MDQQTQKRRRLLTGAAEIAVQHSGGRLRIAHNEEDISKGADKEAAHFLKLDGRRLGRDVELYAWMMELQGDAATLADYIMEVLIPVEQAIPEAGRHMAVFLKAEGRAFVPPEHVEAWNGLFKV